MTNLKEMKLKDVGVTDPKELKELQGLLRDYNRQSAMAATYKSKAKETREKILAKIPYDGVKVKGSLGNYEFTRSHSKGRTRLDTDEASKDSAGRRELAKLDRIKSWLLKRFPTRTPYDTLSVSKK